MKFKKYYEYLFTKIEVVYKQNIFKGNKYKVKYILDKADSDILIVIFSSCTRKGIKARYNYRRTLSKFKVNKLFILDDWGVDKRGVYYLSKEGDFLIERDVKLLIDNIINQLNIKQKIFVGSSKGGYAALYFGIEYENSIIISGAPQYYLGKYLNTSENMHILKYIAGNCEKDSIEKLDSILCNQIKINRDKNSDIYLHCSKNEHTYENHVKYLIEELIRNNINIYLDFKYYEEHSQVSIYYPLYLKDILIKILN